MIASKRVYWDSSCFICLLNADSEPGRHAICTDILNHARDDSIEIWTSCWTIVETIRPREPFVPEPLPAWAHVLEQKGEKGVLVYPGAKEQLERIWDYYHRNTRKMRKLTDEQIKNIRQMFLWPWIRKIQVVPTIATRAAEIARDHNLRPADALHVASALQRSCSEIHAWDRNFRNTSNLIPYKEPVALTAPNLFTDLLLQ
jgi:predicted nucleic acid-binding protein